MLATSALAATPHEAFSSVNSKLEDDLRRQHPQTPTSHVTSAISSHGSMRLRCVTHIMSLSFRTEVMMMGTKVKSQSSHLDRGVVLQFSPRSLLTVQRLTHIGLTDF
jgi:hypothetical protein